MVIPNVKSINNILAFIIIENLCKKIGFLKKILIGKCEKTRNNGNKKS